jgi:HlyD family secretion protein
VVVDAVGEATPYTGKVFEIAGSAVQRPGQQTQVFEVKVVLDTVDAQLRPGMTAKARIETQTAKDVVTVPIQAVMLRPASELAKAAAGGAKAKDDDAKKDDTKKVDAKVGETKESVFVVENGKAKLRAVKTGISDETSVSVLTGLSDGETVVTGPYRGLRDLKDGDAVREKKAETSKEKKDGAKAEVSID